MFKTWASNSTIRIWCTLQFSFRLASWSSNTPLPRSFDNQSNTQIFMPSIIRACTSNRRQSEIPHSSPFQKVLCTPFGRASSFASLQWQIQAFPQLQLTFFQVAMWNYFALPDPFSSSVKAGVKLCRRRDKEDAHSKNTTKWVNKQDNEDTKKKQGVKKYLPNIAGIVFLLSSVRTLNRRGDFFSSIDGVHNLLL